MTHPSGTNMDRYSESHPFQHSEALSLSSQKYHNTERCIIWRLVPKYHLLIHIFQWCMYIYISSKILLRWHLQKMDQNLSRNTIECQCWIPDISFKRMTSTATCESLQPNGPNAKYRVGGLGVTKVTMKMWKVEKGDGLGNHPWKSSHFNDK